MNIENNINVFQLIYNFERNSFSTQFVLSKSVCQQNQFVFCWSIHSSIYEWIIIVKLLLFEFEIWKFLGHQS